MRQVLFIKDDNGGYTAEVPSLPGCSARGKNLSEAIRNIRKAIYAHLASLQAAGQPMPELTRIEAPQPEGVIQHEILLREDVIQAVREGFPDEDPELILLVLDDYGKESFQSDPEAVQIAVVRLSEGSTDKLEGLVEDAKRDFRDVLSWYARKFGKYP